MKNNLFYSIGTVAAFGLSMLLVSQAKAVETTVIPGSEGLSIGGEWFVSYQDGTKGGTSYSRMKLTRGYLNIEKKILKFGDLGGLEGRFTPDIHQDAANDTKLRMKYLYGKLKSTAAWEPYMEFGLVHNPWFDYQEHINRYRVQGAMLIERNGTMNSADFGATVGGFFGPKESGADFGKYPGRYGSFAAGVYNGGGYHADEKNDNKVVEARISVRPFPGVIDGLQFSYFGVYGDGNAVTAADFRVNLAMVSYEQKHLAATVQYYSGKGNQGNSAIDSNGKALDREGYSFFTELRNMPILPAPVSLIGRADHFDYNTDVNNDQSDRYVVGVAWNMGHHNLWLLDYDTVDYDGGDSKDEDRVQLSLQLHF